MPASNLSDPQSDPDSRTYTYVVSFLRTFYERGGKGDADSSWIRGKFEELIARWPDWSGPPIGVVFRVPDRYR